MLALPNPVHKTTSFGRPCRSRREIFPRKQGGRHLLCEPTGERSTTGGFDRGGETGFPRAGGVRVTGDQMSQLELEQPAGALRSCATESTVNRRRSELNHRTGVHDLLEVGGARLDCSAALGVSNDRNNALALQPGAVVCERERLAGIRILEQDESRVAAEAEPRKTVQAEVFELVERDLRTTKNVDFDSGFRDCGPHFGKRVAHGLGRRPVVRSNVRRCSHHAGAVGCHGASDHEGLFEVPGTVVESREDVAVKIDHVVQGNSWRSAGRVTNGRSERPGSTSSDGSELAKHAQRQDGDDAG